MPLTRRSLLAALVTTPIVAPALVRAAASPLGEYGGSGFIGASPAVRRALTTPAYRLAFPMIDASSARAARKYAASILISAEDRAKVEGHGGTLHRLARPSAASCWKNTRYCPHSNTRHRMIHFESNPLARDGWLHMMFTRAPRPASPPPAATAQLPLCTSALLFCGCVGGCRTPEPEPWCPFCKRRHVGGDTCMGHYP